MASDREGWIEDVPNQQDILVKAIRVGLSFCGPVGALLGEVITEFIPAQRIDRLQDFSERLKEQIDDLNAFKTKFESSTGFAALVEGVTLAAIRTPSPDRREQLAALLANGLSKDEAQLIAQLELLKLLEQLNQPQILMLMRYGSFRQVMGNDELHEFIERHKEVFVSPPDQMSSEESRRAWAMHQYYGDSMTNLGLLRDTEGVVKSGHRRKWAITPLGRMLLVEIDKPVAE